uniref:Prokineticin domain-containing protein n=1 Tax=Pinctada fucata TaxID=50426 RepID=A0A194AKK5_PINFU
MKFLLAATIVCLFFSAALAAKSCITSADCPQDECCFNHQGPLIVSRRQLSGILPLPEHKGVCEKYKTKGDYCSAFDTLNGHCGCGQGLHCTFVPAPTAVTAATAAILPVASKRSVYYPGPGSYMCATQN